jgi:hypothetical protein
MLKYWSIDGKEGNIIYLKGEVVYQTRGILFEPIYETETGERYILDNGKLLKVTTNPYNGYCYRQDGK